jgi:hypothetical protein
MPRARPASSRRRLRDRAGAFRFGIEEEYFLVVPRPKQSRRRCLRQAALYQTLCRPLSERKQANDVAFPPWFGGCLLSQRTTPIYAIAFFQVKARLSAVSGPTRPELVISASEGRRMGGMRTAPCMGGNCACMRTLPAVQRLSRRRTSTIAASGWSGCRCRSVELYARCDPPDGHGPLLLAGQWLLPHSRLGQLRHRRAEDRLL